ncbi:MAG: hypothetical protein RLZZ308_162 [Candidatus Parcubacteria bacterium]
MQLKAWYTTGITLFSYMGLDIFYSTDFYAVSAFINCLTSLTLGIIIYFENRKHPVNQIFALFALSVSVWSLGYTFWQISSSSQMALFWVRFFMAAAIFTAPFYFHFVYAFVKKIYPLPTIFFVCMYGIAGFFFLVDVLPSLHHLFVSHVEPALFFPYWPKPGVLYDIYLGLWVSCLLYAGYILIKAYKYLNNKILKRQAVFILFAMIIAFTSGSTNYLLWYGIPVAPFANICVSLYVLILGYAVLKHHLFNIKALAANIVIMAQLFILLLRAVLTADTQEKIINYTILAISTIIGVFLIRSLDKEVKSRNKIENLVKELERANEQLQSLDTLKSEFISLASHQLRSPLTVIKGYASTLTDGVVGELTLKQKEIVTHIYTSAQGLANVVEDFLNVTKIEQGGMKYEFARVDIVPVVQDLVSDMKIASEDKHLTFLSLVDAGEHCYIQADTTKIRQVFLNLVDNSIKYTKEGYVKVTLVKQNNKEVVFSVADSGIGISFDTKAKLFTKFSRGEGSVINSGGSGLGLYLAQEIVKAHNGQIHVTSEGVGKGATFSVVLPIAGDDTQSV